MENKTNKFNLTITLHPNGVVHPILKLMKECSETISFGLKLSENIKTLPEELTSEDTFMRLQFDKPDNDIESQKVKYKDWLITKGLEDLIKGINLSLIEAFFFVSVFHLVKENALKTIQEVEKKFTHLRATANKKPLPGLLSKITPHLAAPLLYEKEIISLNRVRRCLVHRNGIVSKEDVNDIDANVLKVEWLRLRLVYEDEHNEVEITKGHITEKDVTANIKRKSEQQLFKLGEKLNFNYRQFNEFLTTAYLFAMDLGNKLPQIAKQTTTNTGEKIDIQLLSHFS